MDMKKKIHKVKSQVIEKHRDDVIEELVTAFNENNDVWDIARVGIGEFEGYENMNDKKLEEDYEYHFGEEIKIVD